MNNLIEEELESQDSSTKEVIGTIGQMAQNYTLDSNRLLGLLLKLDFQESILYSLSFV